MEKLTNKMEFEDVNNEIKVMPNGLHRIDLKTIKRMYSEEDLREAYFSAIKSTGEGWNGEYANGNNPNIEEKFTEGFEEWFEQFKKK